MNIYEGCIDNSKIIYREKDKSWNKQLDETKAYYENKGYKVIFVFAGNSVFNAARVVLYNKNQSIPECMRKYKYKYVRDYNGEWNIEARYEICDKCGMYVPIICISNTKGRLCNKCYREEF